MSMTSDRKLNPSSFDIRIVWKACIKWKEEKKLQNLQNTLENLLSSLATAKFSVNLIEGKVITALIHLFNHRLFYYPFPSIIPESLIQIDCIRTENKIPCAFFCLWPLGRKGVELQRPNHPVPLFAHLYYGHHHAMLPSQCLLQPGQPGGRLLRHRVLHPLPSTHLLLHLARPHHQGHEDPGGRCLRLISPSKNDPFYKKVFIFIYYFC